MHGLQFAVVVLALLVSPGRWVLPVVGQPLDNGEKWVSTAQDTVTLYDLAGAFGTVGLLAHDWGAGWRFYDLRPGDVLWIQELGNTRIYEIEGVVVYIRQGRRLVGPDGERLAERQVWERIYWGWDLVLQTCWRGDGGFYFVLGRELEMGRGGAE